MQAGDFDPNTVAIRRVYVAGVHRHHVSDELIAVAGSDLPDQVSGVTGAKARTGRVTFGPHQSVVTTPPSPLQRTAGWPPARGDELLIFDEYPTYRYRRATARVTDVRAGLGEGEVDVEWADDLEASLSMPMTLGPIARGMPGEEVTVSGESRRYMKRTGIEPWGIVVAALHEAGYRLLPSVSDVDLLTLVQGNLHPRVGRLAHANASGNVLAWDNTSGFQYVSDTVTYVPGYTARPSGSGLGIYVRMPAGGATASTVWSMTDGAFLRLNLSATSVILSRRAAGESTYTTIVQQAFSTASALPWAAVNVGSVSTRVWTEAGVREVSHGTIGIDWSRVDVVGVAALQVAYAPLAGWPDFNWPSLRFRSAGTALVRETTCTRSIEDKSVRDVLEDIGNATLTGFWLDEQGNLQWMPSNYLEGQSPVETITTRADILAGSWTETEGGVAQTVTTTYEHALITSKSVVGVSVGAASGAKTLNAGDMEEDFIGPDADEEWIEPDMSPLPAGQSTGLMTTEGKRSWWGGSYVFREIKNENGTTQHDSTIYDWANLPFGADYLRFSITEISPRRWAYSHTVTSGAKPVELVTLPNSSSLPLTWRDKPLPIWRARGKVTFADASVSYRRGPSWAGGYTHDIGAWGSRADAQRVGDYLATRMASIQVMLTGIEVYHDPRRQLGDVIEVAAQGTLGGVLRCLIVGIRETSTVAGIEQRLDVRVIRATPSVFRVYADIESATAPYSGIESTTAPYSALEA